MLALNGGRPQLMNLRDMLKAFIAFREEVVTRESKFELEKPAIAPMCLLGWRSRLSMRLSD